MGSLLIVKVRFFKSLMPDLNLLELRFTILRQLFVIPISCGIFKHFHV